MKEIYQMTKEEVLRNQHASEDGLAESEVLKIRQEMGENCLKEAKKKKSGAHLCGAVSGSARYHFDHCGGGVDAVRKCGEHRRDLCCYCDECGAWNGTVPQGGKIVGFAESTVVASCKGAS